MLNIASRLESFVTRESVFVSPKIQSELKNQSEYQFPSAKKNEIEMNTKIYPIFKSFRPSKSGWVNIARPQDQLARITHIVFKYEQNEEQTN